MMLKTILSLLLASLYVPCIQAKRDLWIIGEYHPDVYDEGRNAFYQDVDRYPKHPVKFIELPPIKLNLEMYPEWIPVEDPLLHITQLIGYVIEALLRKNQDYAEAYDIKLLNLKEYSAFLKLPHGSKELVDMAQDESFISRIFEEGEGKTFEKVTTAAWRMFYWGMQKILKQEPFTSFPDERKARGLLRYDWVHFLQMNKNMVAVTNNVLHGAIRRTIIAY